VIVNIAAWYYIVNGALALMPVMMSPFGLTGSRAGLGGIVIAGLLIGIGVGLLKRHEMGRWAALGLSLLGWTLGTLLLLVLLVYLGAAAPLGSYLKMLAGGGLFSALMIMVVLSLLLWVVGILISFKLFWYLCSQEGCAEFGVQYRSSQAVLASCGAWVGRALLNLVFTGAGGMVWQLATSPSADSGQAARQARDEQRMNEARLRAAQERAAAKPELATLADEADGIEEADGDQETDAGASTEPEDIAASAEPIDEPSAIEDPPPRGNSARAGDQCRQCAEEQNTSSRTILQVPRRFRWAVTFTAGAVSARQQTGRHAPQDGEAGLPPCRASDTGASRPAR
jgi:hypothetical protein